MGNLDALRAAKRFLTDRFRTPAMFWFRGPPMNFGDWIGPFLYAARTGTIPEYSKPTYSRGRRILCTVGSIAHIIQSNCIVWGSGIISRDSVFPRPYKVFAVRGPLTQARFKQLGYPCPSVFGDPAILLPSFLATPKNKSKRVAIVPHYDNWAEAVELFSGMEGIDLVDVRADVREVVCRIASAERVISSSLHGLIVAHAYGIPAAWVQFTQKLIGDNVKFLDYYASVGVINPKPMQQIVRRLSLVSLEGLASDAPTVDHSPLRAPLLASCPF